MPADEPGGLQKQALTVDVMEEDARPVKITITHALADDEVKLEVPRNAKIGDIKEVLQSTLGPCLSHYFS
eukprot:6206814-Amphidinium_carterae.1